MKNRVVICFLVLLFLGGSALAVDITKIQLLFAPGMMSDYDAAGGTQTLQSFNGAYVWDELGNFYDFSVGTQTINADFAGASDSSSGGVAHGSFSDGGWLVELYSGGVKRLKVSGGVSWYREDETSPDSVYGEGHITVNWSEVYYDTSYWPAGAVWGSDDGKSAIKVDALQADQPFYSGELRDYDHDWSSDNVTVYIFADSAEVVPEPATIALLGLGSLVLVRRKRD